MNPPASQMKFPSGFNKEAPETRDLCSHSLQEIIQAPIERNMPPERAGNGVGVEPYKYIAH